MMFLHPWAMILGGLGVALPILIHGLIRPKPVRLPLSTLRFVEEAIHVRRTRHRLRHVLILVLRSMAVLLIGWAFARPFVGQRPWLSGNERVNTFRVVLLDVSQSMAATVHGVQAIERARSRAVTYLRQQADLQAHLVFAGARARPVFERFSTNLAALRDALAHARPLPERFDIQSALTMAAEMLTEVPGDTDGPAGKHPRRELVVVSDLQRVNWAEADFAVLPKDTLIRVESVALEREPANLAVLEVRNCGPAEQNQPTRIEVEVANYTPMPRRVATNVEVGGLPYRLDGECPSNGTIVLSVDVVFHHTGWQAGCVRLLHAEDALDADNIRYFVVKVRSKPTYGLLTRQSPAQRPSASYYLERALAPFASRDDEGARRVVRIAPQEVSKQQLTAVDMMVLGHPGKLSRDTIDQIMTFLRRGRAVLYVACEEADVDNLALMAETACPGWQMPVTFRSAPTMLHRHNLKLTSIRSQESPFSIFGDHLSTLFDPLRFASGLSSLPVEAGLKEEVLATLNDGSAFLVITSCGSGTLAILNVDLGISTLPSSPAFVPLIGELVNRLLSQSQTNPTVPCGEPMSVYLPGDLLPVNVLSTNAGAAGDLNLVGPDAVKDDLGALIHDKTGVIWRWREAGPPGIYKITRSQQTAFALATGIPAEESDLRTLPHSSIKQRWAGERNVYGPPRSCDSDSRDHVWAWLTVACVCCLMAELLLLKTFRS